MTFYLVYNNLFKVNINYYDKAGEHFENPKTSRDCFPNIYIRSTHSGNYSCSIPRQRDEYGAYADFISA